MQAPTTWTRGRGFNRLTAGAIGLALLAAAAIGALTLSDQIALPSLGRGEQAQSSSATTLMAEMLFLEENSFDYAVSAPADPSLLRSVEELWFSQETSFDAVVGLTLEEIRHIEHNVWDYEARAQVAGRQAPVAPALSYAQMLFLEENIWGTPRLIPPVDTGEANY